MSDDVQLLTPVKPGQDVIVRGRRIPMLTAYPLDGGKVDLVFDNRLALGLEAGNYEAIIEFIATVMENVMNPDCGRTFNRVVEIAGVDTSKDD